MSHPLPQPVFEELAYYHWHLRGRPLHNPHCDWYEAHRLASKRRARKFLDLGFAPKWLVWDGWSQNVFNRAYLAIEAEINPENLTASLEQEQQRLHHGVLLVVALDGAPDFSYYRFLSAESNGVPAENVVEAKDAEFYRRCLTVLRARHARFLGGMLAPENRVFQDGCVAVFEKLELALVAALYLRQALVAYNEITGLAWRDRLHARMAVASSCRGLVGCLPFAWRDEIVVEPEELASLDCVHQDLCFAANVKPGPTATSDSFPQDTEEAGYARLSKFFRGVS